MPATASAPGRESCVCAVGPAFASDRWLFLSYAEPTERGGRTAVASAELLGTALRGLRVIFRQQPDAPGGNHWGSRLVFARDGMPSQRAAWEALDAYRGRAVRLLRDQTVVLEGIARGIDNSGQLLVETPSGVQAVMSGEVSLRPAAT